MPSETTSSGKFFEEMRVLMVQTFGLEDLKTLCSDRDLVYDNMGGDTLTAKAREIIAECKRTRTLADLVDYCRKHRPNENWPDPPHGVKVAAAFTALGEMLEKDDELRQAVKGFKESFAGANDRIESVNFFKRLHDQLHLLHVMCYDLLVSELKRTDEFKGTYESISKYVKIFESIVVALKKVERPSSVEMFDDRWITKLGQSQMLMAIGADPQSFDLGQIRKAADDTHIILAVNPAKINTLLMAAVGELKLQRLKDAMAKVNDQLTRVDLDQEKAREFKTGIDSLDSLNKRLNKLAMEHNQWQEADVALRLVDEQMEMDISELENAWTRLQSQIAEIYSNSDEKWAMILRLQSEKLDAALKATPKDNAKIVESFDGYRQLAIQRFFDVDSSLLNLCSELGEMGKRLTPLLEIM